LSHKPVLNHTAVTKKNFGRDFDAMQDLRQNPDKNKSDQ
jgi:hypothetical protein